MRYSIRTMFLFVFLFAFGLVAWKSTGEIWVDWYNGVQDWYLGAKSYVFLLLHVLFLGFIAGWLSRTWVPGKTTWIVSLTAYWLFNVVMFMITRTALKWIHFAVIEREHHVSGAMDMLIQIFNSDTLLVLTCCLLIAVTATAFIRQGKFQEACGLFTAVCWLVIIVMGFINAAFSMCL